MCGVFGIHGHSEAANIAYLGLHALQHRGQESAGIVTTDGERLFAHRTMGLVQGEAMAMRFFNTLGASLLDRTVCANAGATGYKYTIGGSIGTDTEQFQDAKLVLIWGGNPIASNLHLWTRLQEAKRRGAKLIAIDPYRSLTAEKCHQHIALMPGTDAALALGMMHVLVKENLLDHDYIEKHTFGFAQLKDRVAEWTPERTAATCGITVEEVVDLARAYGRTARAGEPVAIRMNYGLQRVHGGGISHRNAPNSARSGRRRR